MTIKAMTIKEAIQARLRIQPGRTVRTFGGWCRRDRVLLDGLEIGKIQTRRAKSHTEVLTIAGNMCVRGHDVDWLLRAAASASGCVAQAAAGRL